jgi:anti-sigma factor ChrR (cupin superfamily)
MADPSGLFNSINCRDVGSDADSASAKKADGIEIEKPRKSHRQPETADDFILWTSSIDRNRWMLKGDFVLLVDASECNYMLLSVEACQCWTPHFAFADSFGDEVVGRGSWQLRIAFSQKDSDDEFDVADDV